MIDNKEKNNSNSLEQSIVSELAKEVVESYCPLDRPITLQTTKDERGKFGRILGDFLVYDATTDSWKMLSEILINNHYI